jgi:C1A family cysteine protease
MRIGNEPSAGGHAVCLVGYQDASTVPGGGYFLVRNSWSTAWAYQSPYTAGYGRIPYAYIANENWEAFAPVSIMADEGEQDTEERNVTPVRGTDRTITIRIKGNVNLIIE